MLDNGAYGKTRSGGRISGRKPTLPGAFEAGRYSFAPEAIIPRPVLSLLLFVVGVAQSRLGKADARAALGARAAGRADIATDRLRARDEMAVFRALP